MMHIMARAKRHYIPGQVWHITHRCHKREFLLKFVTAIKKKLGVKAKGRKTRSLDDGYELRENVLSYNADFDIKKGDIVLKNKYACNIYNTNTGGYCVPTLYPTCLIQRRKL